MSGLLVTVCLLELVFSIVAQLSFPAVPAVPTPIRDEDDDGSNTSYHALWALAAIPLLLCFFAILFLMNKRRKADNQYSQDQATYAAAANSPMPIVYDFPQTISRQTFGGLGGPPGGYPNGPPMPPTVTRGGMPGMGNMGAMMMGNMGPGGPGVKAPAGFY
eukprot:TRINITY_DN99372_c0_g1_i1.p1 TRINITY_DN99372_c0_g1~~TRINITY_DN99372_c0_g1_i1.p1  ORF type:complete len:161 (+),score=17.31 TRINITY_DN99372_c0_g1_i1:45-527(+)